jgi:DNA polymerase II small subunit
MKEEVLKVIRERGLLLEKGVLDLLEGFKDPTQAKEFLLNIERVSGQKMITLGLLNKNVEFVNSVIKQLPGEEKSLVENTFVKFGMSLEVRKESEIVDNELEKSRMDYKIFYADTKPDKKLEVKDFTNHFRARYQSMQRILMARPELQSNLVAINKISSDRTSLSIIGIVTEKRITKNKNLIIKFEDLTGEINCLVKADKAIFETGEELQLDDIVGIKGSGNSDMIFAHEIFFPDSFLFEKTKFEEDVNVAFISDIHCGSNKHLGVEFEKFLEWLNSEDEAARKLKYIFIVGDNVDGVGIFPGQENVLNLGSMEEQYKQLIGYLKRVPERITMFMCPGQHDAVRVAEPQPLIEKKYANGLYEIENLVLVTNPCNVKLIEGEKEFKVLMYHGASIHSLINEIKELRMMKAHKCPAKAVRHMLKRRHLAPSHGDVVYIPNSEKDPLFINEVPDVLCTGEVHRLDIENYNGVLIITGSCWQSQTDFEEKVGNIPDPCKVPVLNLKTRELKIFDFDG